MPSAQNYYLRTFHGLILIGLGVLTITEYWWPGILFVLSVAMIVDAIILKKPWQSWSTPIILTILGVLFHFDKMLGENGIGFWPIALIVAGLLVVFSKRN